MVPSILLLLDSYPVYHFPVPPSHPPLPPPRSSGPPLSLLLQPFPPSVLPPPYHLLRKPVCPSFHSRFDFHSAEFCKCMYLLRVVKVTRDKGRRKFSNTGSGCDGSSANGLLRGYGRCPNFMMPILIW
ncbi:hypothetical protein V1478_006966 [Vespula squamosa]|uniref:Uncharacterized protein n=1 Tax=Vespula squamosa TaxID=30214 RepID=A0ABD2B1U3_VESSQ